MILYAYLKHTLIHQFRADHPSNIKRGGVCIYYKESLSVRALNLTNLSECIICEVSIQNCKGYIGVIYRSPNQNIAELKNFCRTLRTF